MTAKRILIFIGLAALIAILGYSLFITISSDALHRGTITTLSDGSAIWTNHMHAFLPISVCGEDLRLPIEVGALTGPHTHEEKNIAHWHDKLPYNPSLQAITETKPLTLGAFFDAISVPFGETRIWGLINGDTCPDGKKGMLFVFVNGVLTEDARSYVWRDQDIIRIFFDTRPLEEIQKQVDEEPITFPKLGRG